MSLDKDTVAALAGLIAAVGNAAAIVIHAIAAMQRPRASQHTVHDRETASQP